MLALTGETEIVQVGAATVDPADDVVCGMHHLSPKEIARALGMPPSAVAPLVRAVAAERGATAGEPEVVGCWVNAGWSRGLSVDESRGWADEAPSDDGTGGLVSVLVARRHRWDKVSVCGYLADVYCLGVKKVLGPDIKDELALQRFLPDYYAGYSNPSSISDGPPTTSAHGKDRQRSPSVRKASRSTSRVRMTTLATSSRPWNARSVHHQASSTWSCKNDRTPSVPAISAVTNRRAR
jgi:hypothetical protein